VVADGMEESVRIGHDARRRHGNHLIQPGRRFKRQLLDQGLIDVGMGAGIPLQQRLGMADDFHRTDGAGEFQRQIEHDRHGAPDVDVPVEFLKPLRFHGDVIRVRWQVAEHVVAHSIGSRGPRIAADRIADSHLHGLHDATGWIFDRALNRPGAAESLRRREGWYDDGDGNDRDAFSDECHVAHRERAFDEWPNGIQWPAETANGWLKSSNGRNLSAGRESLR
jgi:hypothetical protein